MSEDEDKNAKAYAELTQLLKDMSLLLVRREAEDYRRKALKILKDDYAGKARAIAPHWLHFNVMALKNAYEKLSNRPPVAMVLKKLPTSFKMLTFYITQKWGGDIFCWF